MDNEVEIVVKAKDDTRSGFDSARRGASNLKKSIGGMTADFKVVGRSLMTKVAEGLADAASSAQKSISGALSGTLQGALSSGPIGIAILAGIAAVLATIAPLIASLIAGALILGLGAAFVGVGAMVLLQNEKIQAKLSKSWSKITKVLERAFMPLLPVFDTFMDVFLDLAKTFEPVIKQAATLAQGPLNRFIQSLADALAKLAPALGPVLDAFGKVLDDMGPMLPGLFDSIADSIIELADAVAQNSDIIAALFVTLIYLIPRVLDVIRVLTNVFGDSFRWIATTAIPWVIDAFSDFMAWLDGVGEKAGNVVEDVKAWFNGLVENIQSIPARISAFGQRMFNSIRTGANNVVNRTRKFLNGIVDFVRELPGRIAAAASGMFNGIVTAAQNAVSQAAATLSNIPSRIGGFFGFANGGPIGAAASGGGRGGQVIVGENGPELVNLPFGSAVTPASNTRAMLQGGGTTTVVLEINSAGSAMDNLLVELLRKAVRVRGGNVQLVLGTGGR